MAANTMEAIKKKMQSMKLENETAFEKADQLEQKLNEQKTIHDKQNEEITVLRRRIDQLQSYVEQAKLQVQEQTVKLDDTNKQLTHTECEVQTLTKRVRSLEEDFEQTDGRLQAANEKLEEATKAVDESERVIKVLEIRIITDEERISQLENELEATILLGEDTDRKYEEQQGQQQQPPPPPDIRGCNANQLAHISSTSSFTADKRVTPIQKVMNFMKDREYRPTELFRMFDKNVTNGMDNKEIMQRLAKVGLHLHKHEMEELTEYLQRASHPDQDPDQVNFKKMAGGMKTHIERKRLDLMRQIEGEQKLKQLHKKILSHDLNTATGLPSSESIGTAFPPIGAPSTHNGTNSICTTSRMSKVLFGGPGIRGVEEDSDYDEEEERRKALAAQAEAMLSGRMANMGVDPVAERRREPSLLQFGIPSKVKIMSMSTKLGGKSKSFGEAGRKKKKTKKKRK